MNTGTGSIEVSLRDVPEVKAQIARLQAENAELRRQLRNQGRAITRRRQRQRVKHSRRANR